MLNFPTPSRPTQIGLFVFTSCPPATTTVPVAPLKRPMERSSENPTKPLLSTVILPNDKLAAGYGYDSGRGERGRTLGNAQGSGPDRGVGEQQLADTNIADA